MAYPKIQYFKSDPAYSPDTNLLVYPREFDNGNWVKFGGATVTPNAVTYPDGTSLADAINFAGKGVNSNDGVWQLAVAPLVIGKPYTFSVWLRCSSGTQQVEIVVEDDFFLAFAADAIVTVTTDWQLFTITGVPPVGSNARIAVWVRAPFAPALAGFTVYAYDAKLRPGQNAELPFKLPPINKPYVWQEAQRHDIFASGGEKQTTVERIDQFLAIEMPAIFGGDDADAWQDFLTWSIEGGEFEYFPDSDLDDSITCTVEETTAKLERKSYNVYSAKLTFRVAVP